MKKLERSGLAFCLPITQDMTTDYHFHSRSWDTPDLGLYIVNMPETRKTYSISNWRFIRMLQLPMKLFSETTHDICTHESQVDGKKLHKKWFSNGLSSTNRLICQETHPCWALVTSNWANRVKCWPKKGGVKCMVPLESTPRSVCRPISSVYSPFQTTSCQALKGVQNMEGKVRRKKKKVNLPVLLLGWSTETTQLKIIFINTWICSMWWKDEHPEVTNTARENPSPLRIPTTVPKWLASARVSEANLSTLNTGVWDQQASGQQVRQESCCCRSSSVFAN